MNQLNRERLAEEFYKIIYEFWNSLIPNFKGQFFKQHNISYDNRDALYLYMNLLISKLPITFTKRQYVILYKKIKLEGKSDDYYSKSKMSYIFMWWAKERCKEIDIPSCINRTIDAEKALCEVWDRFLSFDELFDWIMEEEIMPK